jgi:WD repeat-containing protein 35
MLGFFCEAISSSSDFSTLAFVDKFSTLQFFSSSNFQPIVQVYNDIWNVSSASDVPNLFAALKKQKLTVFTDNVTEDPIQSLSYIAKFVDYEIMTEDLIQLMRDQLEPSRKIFRNNPTKNLKDLRIMLSLRPQISVDEIIAYAREHSNKKLWDEIAESMMLEMNFSFAERCYLEITNYHVLQFIKRIRKLKNPHIQRAQILSYLGRFDESEILFVSMDRLDLAIEMRANVGDFKHMIALL